MRKLPKAILSTFLAATMMWFTSVAQSGYGTAIAQGPDCQFVGTIQYFMPDGSIWQTDTYSCAYGVADVTIEVYDPSGGVDLGTYFFSVAAPLALLDAAVDAVLTGLGGYGFMFVMLGYIAYVFYNAGQNSYMIAAPCTVYVESCL